MDSKTSKVAKKVMAHYPVTVNEIYLLSLKKKRQYGQ